jgi:hypothetical protein
MYRQVVNFGGWMFGLFYLPRSRRLCIPAELFCLEQVLAGKEANFFTLSSLEAKTTQAITYPTEATEHNTLRPEFLEWLFTSRELRLRIAPRGIFIRGRILVVIST